MKEIKFRAWRPETKEMDYSFLGRCDLDNCLNRRGVFKDWEIMQYTGLKDKNGKEIYESDLLRHDIWGIDEVVWDTEGACFRGKSEKHDITLAHHQLKRTKIIGNIYENPELLK